ncbi:uncharacterized protein A4U43_C09F9200 [Asparagus officinalis]|uniref:Uncharacterized protein n=1 Tax=Asparagus officinalis TaxID=4686 RepID=A0A5P1E6C0_ASPOF|nr:uncharacterized protein A4U43_C09F9200 [Asparagus officinalis]
MDPDQVLCLDSLFNIVATNFRDLTQEEDYAFLAFADDELELEATHVPVPAVDELELEVNTTATPAIQVSSVRRRMIIEDSSNPKDDDVPISSFLQ